MPGKTGCWACLAERIQANAPVLAYLESKRGHTGEAAAHRAATPATLQAAWALTATAVASWVARGELPHLEGKVRSLDVLTAESQTHTLIRLPSCPVCGEPVRADRPVRPVVVGQLQEDVHRGRRPSHLLAAADAGAIRPSRQPDHRGGVHAGARRQRVTA